MGGLDRAQARPYGVPRSGRIAAGMRIGWLYFPEMSEDPPRDALARLGDKLDKARQSRLQREQGGGGAVPRRALGAGFRIAIELVASLCVGLALGWLAYRFLPPPLGVIGFIVFFFLGMAAGMLNVFRAAKGIGTGAPSAAGPRRRPDRDLRDRDLSGP